jgi:hypothetical protein
VPGRRWITATFILNRSATPENLPVVAASEEPSISCRRSAIRPMTCVDAREQQRSAVPTQYEPDIHDVHRGGSALRRHSHFARPRAWH